MSIFWGGAENGSRYKLITWRQTAPFRTKCWRNECFVWECRKRPITTRKRERESGYLSVLLLWHVTTVLLIKTKTQIKAMGTNSIPAMFSEESSAMSSSNPSQPESINCAFGRRLHWLHQHQTCGPYSQLKGERERKPWVFFHLKTLQWIQAIKRGELHQLRSEHR